MEQRHSMARAGALVVLGALALPLIYFISRYSYNLFHALADGLTIVIAACAFVVVWNSRRNVDNNYFTYIGISLLFFAFLDLIHMLGNKNMGVFPGYGNLGPTFYIASRYVLSISLIIAPLFINRKLSTTAMFALYSLATSLIVLSVFYWNIFPVCFVEGVGLTSFKVISDYVICLILLVALGLLFINRRSFDSRVLRTLVFSIVLSIATGLTFTLYTDPFGITNMVGHLFQIASFYFVYVAIIETSLTKPQEILFRTLKHNEEELTENVRQLDHTNVELQQEIAERRRTENALRESEERFMKVFYQSPTAMTITRPSDQTLIDANDSFLSLFEFTRGEAVGRRVVADLNVYVDPDADRGRILGLFSEYGKVPSLEIRMRTKTGKILTVLFSSEMINFSGEGSVACTTIIDITERKRMEEALRQSEERFRLALSNAPVSVAVQDRDLRYIWAYNQRTARPAEIIGKRDSDIFTAEEAEKITAFKRRVLDEGVELHDQMWFDRRNGPICLDVYWEPIRDERGTVTGVGSVTVNQTPMKLAEEALRESEQRWATTLSSIGDAVIATDAMGRITFMNTVAEELTGWTLSEAVAKPVTEVFNIINEHTRNTVEDPVARVLRDGMIVGLANHTMLVRKDGAEVAIDDSGAPIRDKDGKTIGVVLVFRDITERKRAEHAITESEAKYRNLFENMTEEVHFWNVVRDGDGHIKTWRLIDANPPTLKTWGKTLEEIRHKTTDEIFGPGATDHYLPVVQNIMTTGLPHAFEDYFPHLDKHFRFTSVPFGEYFITTGADITGIKKAQLVVEQQNAELEKRVAERTADVEKERQRLYDVLETLPVYVVLLTADYHVPFANRFFTSRFGESEGMRCYEYLFNRTEPCEICETFTVLKTKAPHHWFWTGPDKRDYDIYDYPFVDADGSTMILEMGIDITERKRAEATLTELNEEMRKAYEKLSEESKEREQAEAQLRQSQKVEALGTLTGGIAHDFNNILAAMIGFTELVKDDLPAEDRHQHRLQRVLEAGLRGRDLVKQMLTFARKSEQEKKPLQLSSIVKETAKLLRPSTPTTISIRLDIKSESGLILADPVQLQQVLMNLCTNATHAMRAKGGTLDIVLSDYSVSPSNGDPHGIAPGLYMKLGVRDTGVGIAPEVMDKIFDPFFTTKKVGEGTGLGLSVVMGIVKQLQGYITVESEPGKGSTFSVYFPKIAEEPVTLAPLSDDAIPRGSERVLFVDDEEALVEMGEEILKGLGYQVTSCTNSREALALFRLDPSQFDIIITDQTMPELTGVELARAILAIRPDTPVILATGFSHLVDAGQAKAAGIKAFTMKPLTKREIAKTVRTVLLNK